MLDGPAVSPRHVLVRHSSNHLTVAVHGDSGLTFGTRDDLLADAEERADELRGDGQATWNSLASQCFNTAPTCP